MDIFYKYWIYYFYFILTIFFYYYYLVNVILSGYLAPELVDEWLLDPVKGNVAFGCGKDCWAFTLQTFAKMYASKFKCDIKRLQYRLWGDNFFDRSTKKWKHDNTPTEPE